MSVFELVAQFKNKTLKKELWTHEAHLTVGLFFVFGYDDEALSMLRKNISELNMAHGKENTETSGYHETLTVFWVNMIKHYLDTHKCDTLDEELVEKFLSSKFSARELPFKYYSKDFLMSVKARKSFVSPDLRPF